MVKLSAELIEQAAQYTNPVRDRELDLRGWFVFLLLSLCGYMARSAFVRANDEKLFRSSTVFYI